MTFPSKQFAAALARTYHPQMEPDSVAYLERHFLTALEQIGWEVRPKAADGQMSAKERRKRQCHCPI